MKRKILLLLAGSVSLCTLQAQKNKTTAYAITGVEKGQNNWTEVRLIDISTGEEVKSVYRSTNDIEILNARSGKPVVKRDLALQDASSKLVRENAESITKTNNNAVVIVRKIREAPVQSDKPFATNSAACAYDKKHDRLYYTPMGINQLRYIDLKSSSPRIYYFEDEPFGALSGSGDIPNQITRMVIASDGNGYALTNNGHHLIQFTTGKKPVITDLGSVSDMSTGGTVSVHSQSGYGGDMIADAHNNLYLITANRNVFKISIDSRTAEYLGAIKGMPKGFTTNGAVAEGGSKVIVSSSNSTQGYYRFDLTTLDAEKISNGGPVFNASDLANGTLAFEKEKKKKNRVTEDPVEIKDVMVPVVKQQTERSAITRGQVAAFPNPVTGSVVNLSFANQPHGKYEMQLLDITGKLISAQQVTIHNKSQVEEFRLPTNITKGNYLIKVVSATDKNSISTKLVVE
ncbi:MAG TPA: T9SS type A sorting domain-containing protein [Flavisolibacter sp.]|nr:T9SS type A sorting domain-containing protein [Flavisolibacter sp.]